MFSPTPPRTRKALNNHLHRAETLCSVALHIGGIRSMKRMKLHDVSAADVLLRGFTTAVVLHGQTAVGFLQSAGKCPALLGSS